MKGKSLQTISLLTLILIGILFSINLTSNVSAVPVSPEETHDIFLQAENADKFYQITVTNFLDADAVKFNSQGYILFDTNFNLFDSYIDEFGRNDNITLILPDYYVSPNYYLWPKQPIVLDSEKHYYIWVRQATIGNLDKGLYIYSTNTDNGPSSEGFNTEEGEWQWIMYTPQNYERDYFKIKDFNDAMGLVLKLKDSLDSGEKIYADSILITSDAGFDPNNAVTVNILDANIDTSDFENGEVIIKCTTDGYSNSVFPQEKFSVNAYPDDVRFLGTEKSGNDYIYKFKIFVDEDKLEGKTYEYGCNVFSGLENSDLTKEYPYPGTAIITRSVKFPNLNGNEDEIVCDCNADCNDHDSSTIDKCVNPGTTDSYCSNKERSNNVNNGYRTITDLDETLTESKTKTIYVESDEGQKVTKITLTDSKTKDSGFFSRLYSNLFDKNNFNFWFIVGIVILLILILLIMLIR